MVSSRRPLRVMLLTNCYPDRWCAHYCVFVERQVSLLRRRGVEVQVIAPRDSRTGPLRSPWKYLRFGLDVFRSRSGAADLVHAHFPFPAGVFALPLAWRKRVPLLVTSHGAYVDDRPLRAPVRWLVRLVLRRADAVSGVGLAHRKNIAQLAGIDVEDILATPMGIVVPRPVPTRSEARRRLGIDAGAHVVMFIGNLIHRKGVDVLQEAIAGIRGEVPGLLLLVGGDGDERAAVEQRATDLGLVDLSRMLGAAPPDAVCAWFAAADVVVVPSRSEPLGLVALEAMAAGTPVVVSDVEGLGELVTSGSNGLSFPPGDASALGAAVVRILVDPALASRLLAEGRITAAAHDARLAAERMHEIYEALATERLADAEHRTDARPPSA